MRTKKITVTHFPLTLLSRIKRRMQAETGITKINESMAVRWAAQQFADSGADSSPPRGG